MGPEIRAPVLRAVSVIFSADWSIDAVIVRSKSNSNFNSCHGCFLLFLSAEFQET